ncbi:hypothetical protein, partial [Xanthomonas translucens]|uniref:hypothetical protein n=1 Tax=Xanthomonas campestris pv. translucens TaxID=343 RepID=UPI0019D386FB
ASGADPGQAEGWIPRDLAVDLFKRAGLDFEALEEAGASARLHAGGLGTRDSGPEERKNGSW